MDCRGGRRPGDSVAGSQRHSRGQGPARLVSIELALGDDQGGVVQGLGRRAARTQGLKIENEAVERDGLDAFEGVQLQSAAAPLLGHLYRDAGISGPDALHVRWAPGIAENCSKFHGEPLSGKRRRLTDSQAEGLAQCEGSA